MLSCSGTSNRISDVNCGTYGTFATTSSGQILAFGLNNYGQLALPGECGEGHGPAGYAMSLHCALLQRL